MSTALKVTATLKLSRERVRLIETKALNKIQKTSSQNNP
jgi:DNA-directed RNA polymerase sigma subunit (sigma70/sigma32)